MPTIDRAEHWQHVYATRLETTVSWYEDTPALSLDRLMRAGLAPGHAVIDVGGGASRLAETLIARRQAAVTVLDIAPAALALAQSRLGAEARRVSWVAGDVTRWTPDRKYDFWHDRAVFHFLVDAEDRDRYVRVLSQALAPDGIAVIGTFAPDGPERCSGLPVVRYDPPALAATLGPGFGLLDSVRHEHLTPAGKAQQFQFSTFRRI